VFVALCVLTYLTVAATWIDLGEFNIWIALGIATVKAALVALYFMHLRYDHPFNGLIFVASLLFLALFLAITLIDTAQYQPDIQNW
jgi:cytochrome c oxidase subunit 4